MQLLNVITSLVAIGVCGFIVHAAIGWKGEKWKEHMENPYTRGSTKVLVVFGALVLLSAINSLFLHSILISLPVFFATVWLLMAAQGIMAEEGTLVRVQRHIVERLQAATFKDHDGKTKVKEGVDYAKVMFSAMEEVLDMEPRKNPFKFFLIKDASKNDPKLEAPVEEMKGEAKTA